MKHRLGDAPARMMKHRLGEAPARTDGLPRAVGICLLGLAVAASGAGTALGQEGPQPSDGRAGATLTAAAGGGPPSDGECADGVDNDGDGATDFEDTDCASEHDPTEGHGDPMEAHWARAVRLRLSEWTKGSRRRLVVFGRVTLPEGGPRQCVRDMPVDVARRVDGGWVHLGRAITNEDGWYVAVLRDRTGRYRATAPRRRAHLEDGEARVCRRAIRVQEHRHPR